MALKQVLDVYEILDDIHVNGEVVTEYAKAKESWTPHTLALMKEKVRLILSASLFRVETGN